jgi:hypothetical protein
VSRDIFSKKWMYFSVIAVKTALKHDLYEKFKYYVTHVLGAVGYRAMLPYDTRGKSKSVRFYLNGH